MNLKDWVTAQHAVLRRLSEIVLGNFQKDIDRFDDFDIYENVALVAYWDRYVDLSLGVSRTMGKYEEDLSLALARKKTGPDGPALGCNLWRLNHTYYPAKEGVWGLGAGFSDASHSRA